MRKTWKIVLVLVGILLPATLLFLSSSKRTAAPTDVPAGVLIQTVIEARVVAPECSLIVSAGHATLPNATSLISRLKSASDDGKGNVRIGDVLVRDPSRRTGTEHRVSEGERKILGKWPFFESEEEVRTAAMICVKYRLTRSEIISMVGYTPVTNGVTLLGYPYGPGQALFFGFDTNGNLVSAGLAGHPPLYHASER